MKKKILNLIIKFFIIVFVVASISKVFHYYVLAKSYNNIMTFRKESNRYFCVNVVEKNKILKWEIFLVNNTRKRALNYDAKYFYNEFSDFDNNINYSFKGNKVYKNLLNEDNKNINDYLINVYNIPNLIIQIKNNNNINFSKLFDVRYIIPTKYNNKFCYKIVGKNEYVIIDKETFLPEYCLTKICNSDGSESIIEYTYEYEIGTVTDEDVMLPDLTNYEIIENQ